ncbi:hypothetical protein A4D02_33050 [Niastella koreensis]|uniref:Uncharacterized protein n=2 Tax=Niastella koreensis TaxID=354356 RepID=G8THK0_NIAKG|nr:hypothetical protein [Niastella koreensis]AEV97428.1 hypothetical protein Niako_1049 [Niastella koreensis GR20-10]OQP45490.1 hypothetical protein A4D02_33050 [Niastella koreensis]
MSNQFQDLLNALIKAKLPDINTAVPLAIRNRGLDPMINVTSGSQTIGSINLGICTADATASYVLQNLNGLSTLRINSLAITSIVAPKDGLSLHGTVQLNATVTSNLGIHLGGSFRAGCGFLKPSVGLGGNVTISSVSINATGDFDATIGNQICLTHIEISHPGLNYGGVNVNIDGLGIFNSLLHPLEGFILGLVKGPIISLIEGAVTPAINNALNGIFPQCTSLA